MDKLTAQVKKHAEQAYARVRADYQKDYKNHAKHVKVYMEHFKKSKKGGRK